LSPPAERPDRRLEKLGILGGTFDPIHSGHIAMAQAARQAHGLDRVLLVPAARPPHKERELAPAADRLAMARLAAESAPGIEASDIEIRRGGTSYTAETLEELARERPDAELYFILGADSVPELKSWWRLPRIFELARLVVVNRPGCKGLFPPEQFQGIPGELLERAECDRVQMPPVPVSSTGVRKAVRRGEPLGAKVPPGVEEYIRRRGLYRGGRG
jgi:nicotinate-nucleotide adenylyltransferase